MLLKHKSIRRNPPAGCIRPCECVAGCISLSVKCLKTAGVAG
jgi:hypothetical protein